jgi:large-conductance mechanosensitive channel
LIPSKPRRTPAPTLNYRLFTNTVLDFVLVAFVVFLLLKRINKATEKKVGSLKEMMMSE